MKGPTGPTQATPDMAADVGQAGARPIARFAGVALSITGIMVGCGQASDERGADARELRRTTVVVAAASEPSSLLPPFATDLVAGQLVDLVYRRLAEPAPGFSTVGDRDYRPALAARWAWAVDSQSVRFTLDSAARWQDGRAVTSRDVRFTFELLRDPATASPRAPLVAVVDSVTTPDPRTAVVWAGRRSPTLFHQITYHAHILPAHLLDTIPRWRLMTHPVGRRPVGSGPFRLVRWAPHEAVVLEAMRRPLPRSTGIARVVVRVLPDYQAALVALETGEADVIDYVRPGDAVRLARDPRLALLRLPGYGYVCLQFNLHAGRAAAGRRPPGSHPLFGDARVRRTLAMAVDRHAIVANVLDSLGSVALGPVTRAQATADTTLAAPPYDPAHARALLDTTGWRVDPARPGTSAGVPARWRLGRRLAFTVLVPSSSATRLRAAVLLQQMFAQVGAAVAVERLDNAAVVAALERGDFDASLSGFHVDPDPAGIREAWAAVPAGGRAGRTGAFNYGGYDDPVVDAVLDSAASEGDAVRARALYRRVYQRILDDVPAVFLYEPVALVAYDRRLRPTGVRADAWWAGLERWGVADAANPVVRARR